MYLFFCVFDPYQFLNGRCCLLYFCIHWHTVYTLYTIFTVYTVYIHFILIRAWYLYGILPIPSIPSIKFNQYTFDQKSPPPPLAYVCYLGSMSCLTPCLRAFVLVRDGPYPYGMYIPYSTVWYVWWHLRFTFLAHTAIPSYNTYTSYTPILKKISSHFKAIWQSLVFYLTLRWKLLKTPLKKELVCIWV